MVTDQVEDVWDAWPLCPDCQQRRQTVCPVCDVSGDDFPLADVPPDEASVGFQYRPGAWSYEARLTARAKKTDVAVRVEEPIPAAELLRVSVGRRLGGAWSLSISGSNLLDEQYFQSADRKASAAPGRSFGLQLVREGG